MKSISNVAGIAICFVILFASSCFWGNEGKLEIDNEPLSINMKLCSSNNMNLCISLQNRSDTELEIAFMYAPWMFRPGFVLVLVTARGQEIIPEFLAIEDPPIGSITLKPREKIQGVYCLSLRWPSLADELKHDDVIVFWSYQFRSLEGECRKFQRQGGWLQISKEKGGGLVSGHTDG